MNLKLVLNSLKSDRQELEVSTLSIIGFSALWTASVYLLLLPFRNTYVGALIYERGFTQILVILFASFVLSFLGLKVLKIREEAIKLKKDYFPPTNRPFRPSDQAIAHLQDQLGREPNLLARRCSRVLGAYIYSQSREVATEFAIEDANFYQSRSEASYLLPRILVWAIPLLGFIGTVLGISSAVNGFSQFLNQSDDVAQIKEGIGTVTSGLAIAFDTTLLALLISVIVMIPLVLVERMESRLLLGIDSYINDKILPRFRDVGTGATLDQEILKEVIDESLVEMLPSSEALIQPAHSYAEQAVEQLTEKFVEQLQPLQQQVQGLLTSVDTLQTQIQTDRQTFLDRIPSPEDLVEPAHTYAKQATQQLVSTFTQEVQPLHSQVQGVLTSVDTLQTQMQADRQTFLDRIPSPEDLVEPAHTYAKHATQQLVSTFTQEVQPLHSQVQGLLNQVETLHATLQGDRQLLQTAVTQLIESFETRIPSAESLVQPAQLYAEQAADGFIAQVGKDMGLLQEQVQQVIQQFDTLQADLNTDRQALNTALHQAATALQDRVEQLAIHSAQVNEVSQLQTSLVANLKSLKETATLESILGDLQQAIRALEPGLQQLNKPKKILLVEQQDVGDS